MKKGMTSVPGSIAVLGLGFGGMSWSSMVWKGMVWVRYLTVGR